MVCSQITTPPTNASSWLSLKKRKTSQAKLIWCEKKNRGRLGRLLLNSDSRHSFALLTREVQPMYPQCLTEYLAQPRYLVIVWPHQRQEALVGVVCKATIWMHIQEKPGALCAILVFQVTTCYAVVNAALILLEDDAKSPFHFVLCRHCLEVPLVPTLLKAFDPFQGTLGRGENFTISIFSLKQMSTC